MLKPLHLLASCLLVSHLFACNASGIQPNPPGFQTLAAPTDAELNQLAQSPLTEANTDFAIKVFQDLYSQSPRANHFMSPLSLSIALSMLYNGASGETQQEMAKALQLQGISPEQLNQGNLTLRKRLANPGKGVEIAIANALWGKKGIEFNPAYLQKNKDFYNAQLTALDFALPSAVSTINQWASDNTRGKIPKVLESINPEIILILMNAIYFKGDWHEPFKESSTQPQTFYKADGTEKQHPMMVQFDKYRYLKSAEGKFQAMALPYGKDQQQSMLLFLPDQGQSLENLVTSLSQTNWQSWMTQMRSREGRVVLPRFKIKTEMPLNDTLKRLGMIKAFQDGEAELQSLLASPTLNPYVSQVKQDAFVEVNEKGTEAAAVTTITVGATSVQLPQEPFEMVLDRPFLYAIYDQRTQSILFMGALNEPL